MFSGGEKVIGLYTIDSQSL